MKISQVKVSTFDSIGHDTKKTLIYHKDHKMLYIK